jgi:hypothetical protein
LTPTYNAYRDALPIAVYANITAPMFQYRDLTLDSCILCLYIKKDVNALCRVRAMNSPLVMSNYLGILLKKIHRRKQTLALEVKESLLKNLSRRQSVLLDEKNLNLK